MQALSVPVGARLFDSLGFSQSGGLKQAAAAVMAGYEGFIGYLEVMNSTRLAAVLNAGLGFIPITFANEYRTGANRTLGWLKSLGVPQGVTVFADLEAVGNDVAIPSLISQLNTWAAPLSKAGYIPSLYVGQPQPLSGPELAALGVYRYFSSAGIIEDRNGKQWPEPTGCGFCLRQVYPQGDYLGFGYPIDVSLAGEDRKGRSAVWVKG